MGEAQASLLGANGPEAPPRGLSQTSLGIRRCETCRRDADRNDDDRVHDHRLGSCLTLRYSSPLSFPPGLCSAPRQFVPARTKAEFPTRQSTSCFWPMRSGVKFLVDEAGGTFG